MKKQRVPKRFRGTHLHTYLNENGEKILVISKIGKHGTKYKKKFSVKCLLDENGNSTKQTQDEEQEMFKKPITI